MKYILIFSMCAWAQTRPELGKMLDSSGAVRTVYGIAASVSVGDAEAAGVVSSGCGHFCLTETMPAAFAFDGDVAYIWSLRSKELRRWHDGVQTKLDLPSTIYGEVLSIGVHAGAVQFAVRRARGDVWIINLDGSVAGALPHGTSAAMLIPGGAVYAARSELVAGNARFPLAGVTSISWMSDRYLQVRASGVDYALRIELGREALFQLPGVTQ